MRRLLLLSIVTVLGFGCTPQPPQPPPRVDQGPDWTLATRASFYSQDQGSQLMPLRWFKALKQPNGDPFLINNMARYGYLANNEAPTSVLPVGFTSAGLPDSEVLGMTCAACHTRDIEVKGVSYRIDGGPAIADFQAFLSDLDNSVNTVITDADTFHKFAVAVLSQPSTPEQEAKLMADLKGWYLEYRTLMHGALPPRPWGPSRLDAVSMIFDRLTGLDLGKPPFHLIPGNIQPADAPVRYPFLWNAPIQDKTQWPGFAENGNNLLALTRNLGEVFGVFGTFHPIKDPTLPLKVNYLKNNSANFEGLDELEDLIKKLGPPKFPWTIDAALAAKGGAIYARATAQGGCADCHGIAPGATRPIDQHTWKTPLMDVGTDTREYSILVRTARTGVLSGAKVPGLGQLQPVDRSFSILGVSVGGSILQRLALFTTAPPPGAQQTEMLAAQRVRDMVATMNATSAMKPKARTRPAKADSSAGQYVYESRVLQGIWAAAPYLHNGSVPTLADLLKPAAERPVSFKIGPAYDISAVGLAVQQTKFDYTLTTTDCSDRSSGDSRCGHEFGTTTLTPDEKTALLEYLKQL